MSASRFRPVAAFGFFVLVLFGGRDGLAASVFPPPAPSGYPERILGRADAPVTIIEYLSLSCLHCAAFNQKVLPKVKTDFIDSGKVRLIVRDFPLDPVSMAGGMIARSAPESLYFPLINTIFAQQDVWLRAANPLEALKGYARLAGLPNDAIAAALESKELFNAMQTVKDQATAEWNIDATPTFVINGKVVKGHVEYDVFAREIKALLP